MEGPLNKYCMCCGEEVPTNIIVRDGRQEETCTYCGFTLDVVHETRAEVTACILTAEDSKFIRDLIKDALLRKELTKEVLAFENGSELVAAFSRRVSASQPVDMFILDLNMPVMDGIATARTIRALEGQHRLHKMPILFFSSARATDDLKKQLSLFTPAVYMNKGSDSAPARLAERVDQLINYIVAMQSKKS